MPLCRMVGNARTLLLILSVFVGLAANAQNTASVSLKDTLQWMHNFAADHAFQFTGQRGSDEFCKVGTPNCVQRHDASTFYSQGCSATVTWSIDLAWRDSAKYVYQFSLKDLDPESVTLTKTPAFQIAVWAETTNSEKKVNEVINGHVPTDGGQTFVDLVFSSEDDAKRFVKAFKHAIQLCGGKPSVF